MRPASSSFIRAAYWRTWRFSQASSEDQDVFTYQHLRHSVFVAKDTDSPEYSICLLHEERVKDRYGQFDVSKVARTLEVGQIACLTATMSVQAYVRFDEDSLHVFSTHRPKLGIIQPSSVWEIQIVEQNRVIDFLNRDGPDILGSEERER